MWFSVLKLHDRVLRNVSYVGLTHVNHKYVTRFEPLHPMRQLHQTDQKGKLSSNEVALG